MKKIVAVIVLALAMLLFAPLAEAQKGKVWRIGYLNHKLGPGATDEIFRQTLRDLGWVEGKNIRFEYRWAAGKLDRLPALAEELVLMKVDLLVVSTQPGVLAAKKATTTIPIVMTVAADVVQDGIVASLAQPGGNVTGMSEQYSEINVKLLELLHETLPKVRLVAFLWNPATKAYARTYKKVQALAPALGITIQSLPLRNKNRKKSIEELESALEAAARERAGALVVMAGMYSVMGRQIAAFSLKHRVPVFSMSSTSVEKHFGLMAYSPAFIQMYRRAAHYADKILKGAKPADLPVEQPTKFNLVINLKTAKKIGVTIPPELLFRATKVIK